MHGDTLNFRYGCDWLSGLHAAVFLVGALDLRRVEAIKVLERVFAVSNLC